MGEAHKLLKQGGLRKVVVSLSMFFSLCALLYCKALDQPDFTSLSKIIVLAMCGGNAVEHLAPNKEETPSAA